MRRVTINELDAIVKRINESTGNPTSYCTKTDNGYKINVGNYHLDGAYGGYALVQTVNDGGGIRTVIPRGTKRELRDAMYVYLQGMQDAKDN